MQVLLSAGGSVSWWWMKTIEMWWWESNRLSSRGGHFVSGDLKALFMHGLPRRENEASRA